MGNIIHSSRKFQRLTVAARTNAGARTKGITMKWNKVVFGVVGGIAVALGVAATAMADSSSNYITADGVVRSNAYYTASKDRVSTTDMHNDGWGSRARWELNRGGGGFVDDTAGAVSSAYATPSFGLSTQLRIKSCSTNNGVEVGCDVYAGWSSK